MDILGYGAFQFNTGDHTTFTYDATLSTPSGDSTYRRTDRMKLDPAVLGGFGGAFAFKYFDISISFLFGKTTLTMDSVTLTPMLFHADFTADISFLSTPVKPLLVIGFGAVTFTKKLTQVEEYSETDNSFITGAGVRLDRKRFFCKGIYKLTWTTIEGSDSRLLLMGPHVQVGWRFPFGV
jgi:hypothetical protein